ncbi:MAG: hypothetical protein LBD99_06285 [Candidatus Margulisbacteria bacterium]|jgi:hypothetical protein|nr:hypothetical protein [Candidatus Margulisiibacteriota bacterium]
MLGKTICLKENKFSRIIFFSKQDRSLAGELITALDKTPAPQQIHFAAAELMNKGQRWLVNGIQRFNLNKISYLTMLCHAFALSPAAKQKKIIAANVNRFIAEINIRGAAEINMALVRTPCRIIAAYQAKDSEGLTEAVNDYRQILEQPMYARGLLDMENLRFLQNKFKTISADSLNKMLAAQNVSAPNAKIPPTWNDSAPPTIFNRVRRLYRNLRPIIRNSCRVLAGVSFAAAFFALFPAADFPVPNAVLINTLLNLFTNSIMLCISARGTKFWQYRLSDISLLKLSQSVMYSSCGLPLTQSAAYLLQNILAGANNLLFANAATLLGVGLAGAVYTFLNNKGRGKNPLETKLNTLRPVFGSSSALALAAAAGGLPQNYLTLLAMVMGNAYRLIVEGAINYSLYKRFIYQNLKQLELASNEEEKLIKFNIEAMSFIENPGGASSVQSYLNTLEPPRLIRLFKKLGQDRSRHLANIQSYSYADPAQAEYYFSNTYFRYRQMLALAVRAAGQIKKSSENLEAAENAADKLLPRIKNLSAAQARMLRAETLSKTFSRISKMSAGQINEALLALYLVFQSQALPAIQAYVANLGEEQLSSGIAAVLQRECSPRTRPAARKLLAVYIQSLVRKTQSEYAKHIIYKGLS